jgi:hypothetical protein
MVVMSTQVNGTSVQPWDRQDQESEAAYRAFCVFRNMGSERSLAGACRLDSANRKGSAKSPNGVRFDSRNGRWRTWSKKFHWAERALTWDRHNSDVSQKALDEQTASAAVDWAKRRDEAIEQQYRDAVSCRDKARAVLARIDPNNADTKALRDATAVIQSSTGLLHEAIDAALPDPDADFDPSAATIEQLKDFLARRQRERQARRSSYMEAPQSR